MLLTVTFTARLTRARRRHGRCPKLRPFVHYEGELEVDLAYTPGSPGRYGGPPERCYPDEPDEVEVLSARDLGSGRMVFLAPTPRPSAVSWEPPDYPGEELLELARESVFEEASDDFERDCRGDW